MPESVQNSRPRTTETQILTSYDPRTGEVAGNYAIMGSADVARTLLEAREAAQWWGALGFSARKRWLLDWKRAIARRAGELAEVVSQETGKPHTDALLEVMLAVEHLDWAARNAGAVLGRKRVPPGKLARTQTCSVGYVPYGVVGVIGSWNYPVHTPMGSISYAMAAGNAVVFKPSELTPGVGAWLAESWHQLAPNQPVLQVVTGEAGTGAALCRARVDKIAFDGRPENAKKVMAACAETLTPVLISGGGNDAMLVGVDAKIDDAAEAAVFGAMTNAGQTRAGIERVFVADSIYEPFLEQVVRRVKRLKPGADRGASYGPMTREEQVEVVRRHVRDALAKGGKAVVGGLDSIREPYIEPIVLTDVPEDSLVMTEKTGGPVLVINRVENQNELKDLYNRLNAGPYGLGVSVFTRDIKTALTTAERMRAGVVTVNSVLGFVAVPSLPFGGVGQSGFGRIHGEDGLREFARSLSITRLKSRGPFFMYTFDRKPRQLRILKALFRSRHARGS